MPFEPNDKIAPDPSAVPSAPPPIAQAVVVSVSPNAEAASLRERVALQEQKIAEQQEVINQQAQRNMALTRRYHGRYLQKEDMNLRMKFLRQRACTLACSPLRIVPSLLMGWAAMWVFIWCYFWTVATTIATWFALQSLHLFSCCNSPFVEYAQHMVVNYAGQQNCWWWKASYKLESGQADNEQMFYSTV